MCSGSVLVRPRMWPETTETAPNSPIARAFSSTIPKSRPKRMFGSVTRRKVCQPLAPSESRGLLLLVALLLHQRDQLARDEREGDEEGREHDARHREDDLHVVLAQPGPEPALQAEEQHEDQARDHGRDREGQVDQRDQRALAAELELRDRPGGRHAERGVQRHADRGDQQREADRGARVGLARSRRRRRRAPARRPRRRR